MRFLTYFTREIGRFHWNLTTFNSDVGCGGWGVGCGAIVAHRITQNNTEIFFRQKNRRTKYFRQKNKRTIRQKNIRTIRQKNISTKGKTSKCGVKTIDLDKIQELKHPNVG